jgi:Arc/MetJ-type ribon-helix-helix transcriptional regulator
VQPAERQDAETTRKVLSKFYGMSDPEYIRKSVREHAQSLGQAERYLAQRQEPIPKNVAEQHPSIVAMQGREVADAQRSVEEARQAEVADKMLSKYGVEAFIQKGALYSVDLKPEPDQFLLWDKPLAKQSTNITRILKDSGLLKEHRDFQKDYAANLSSKGKNGEHLYHMLVDTKGSPRAASEYLRSIGVRGIKYVDANSRGKRNATFNYVIFDDKDVEIKEVLAKAFVERANELAQRPIEEVIKGIKFSSTAPHRLKVNEEAYLALHGAYNSIESQKGRNFPGFTGVFNDPDYVTKLTNKLNEAARYYKRQGRPLWELSQAIKQAAKSDGTVILYRDDSEHAIPHEEAHRDSYLASQGKGLEARHGNFGRLYNSPEMQKARTSLLEYYPDIPGVLVEEAYAHIIEGNYEAIGLTEDEAASFMDKWSRSFEQKNGRITPTNFGETYERIQAQISRHGSVGTSPENGGQASSRAQRGVQEVSPRKGEESSTDASEALAKVDTNTEAFKRWFGSSRVVDEKGEPLVVYHGTEQDFEKFSSLRGGKNTDAQSGKLAFFFTNEPTTAGDYAGIGGGRTVKALKEKVDQLERIAQRTNRNSDWDKHDEAYQEYENAALAEGDIPEGTNVLPVYLSLKNPLVKDFGGEEYREESYADLIKQAKRAGHDGVIFKNTIDPGDEKNKQVVDVYGAFSPTQIKSATGNRGTFSPSDPNILRKSDKSSDAINNFKLIPEKDEKNLIVAHNLSERNLLFADKMGGLALPSLAITKKDSGFSGYGEITLLADKSLIDPKKKVPVTDADMYSPRYPSVRYDVNSKRLENYWKDVAATWEKNYGKEAIPDWKRHGAYSHWTVLESLKDDGAQALRSEPMVMAHFLAEKGYELPKNPDTLRELVRDGKYKSEYLAYTEDVADLVTDGEKFFKGFTPSGNRRYAPYTLDNVVRKMKSEMKEGEGFNYGAGSVRSKTANRFKSIAQIQKARGQIVSREEMAQGIKDEMNDRLLKLAQDAALSYKYKADSFSYVDNFTSALMEGIQKKNLRRAFEEYGFENLDLAPIVDYLDTLRAQPTEYFEAKPQRAVGLQEFSTAVVPDNISDRARSVLRKHGLKVVAYKAGDDAARSKAVQQASEQGDLLFKRTPPRALPPSSRASEAGFINLPSLQNIKDTAVSLANLPRALMTSFDLSAPLRQGAIFTLTEPRLAAKAFADMIRGISSKRYATFKQSLDLHPLIELAEESGLHLTSLAGDKLEDKEEVYMSNLAEKIPGVKQSEQAYVSYLDSIRMGAFEKYAREMGSAGITSPESYKAIARFINAATGRGDLGKTLNTAAPVLNSIFFSPRYLASRIQLMNPVEYMKMPAAARKIAMRKMFEFAALLGLTLFLIKQSGGDVNLTNPESPDWLKVKVGNTRYDFLAGFQQPARFAYRLAESFHQRGQGKRLKESEQPGSIIGRFLRSKENPGFSLLHDYVSGKDFNGEPFQLLPGRNKQGEMKAGAVGSRLVPMIVQDAYEGYKDAGGAGIARSLPATMLGVGVQTYSQKRGHR